MKTLITLTILYSLVLSSNLFASNCPKKEEIINIETTKCQIFTNKANEIESNPYSKVVEKDTLKSYKHRAEYYCKEAEKINMNKELKNYNIDNATSEDIWKNFFSSETKFISISKLQMPLDY